MDKPNKSTALQTAAFGVILLVAGMAGALEQHLIPGAFIMAALVALAWWLVAKSNQVEEEMHTDFAEEDITDVLGSKFAEAFELMEPAERRKFLQELDLKRKEKAALGTAIPKTASSRKATHKQVYCKAGKGVCQV